MKRELLLLDNGGNISAALIEDGVLAEYHPHFQDDSSGLVRKGIIERYVPGMQAAFVKIGCEENGFLPLDETLDRLPSSMQSKKEIIVQIKKTASKEKLAYLTQNISLTGAYIVYMPLSSHVGVSAKIRDESIRTALELMAHSLCAEDEGIIIRTAAQHVSMTEIENEWLHLKERWQETLAVAGRSRAPCTLDADDHFIHRLLNAYHGHVDTVITDSNVLSKEYGLDLYSGLLPLESVYQVDKQLTQAKNRRVWLGSGGFLVIDPCEALTVIDVNTGRFTGKHSLEDTVLKVNLEACREIAKQIRLRNLSGIILIDFIDMQSDDARQCVQTIFKNALAVDRKKVEIHGYTKLGIMEITRTRDSLPLMAALKE